MSTEEQKNIESNHGDQQKIGISRRYFLTGAAAVSAAAAVSLSPLLSAEEVPTSDDFIQKHYKELTAEDKKEIFARLEAQIKETYNVDAKISDSPPIDGVEFAYVLNLGRCIGCRKCVYACMDENNQSRSPQKQYIRVLKMKKGTINLETASHDYPEKEAASGEHFYMPVACQQCREPKCIEVCPVKATWKEKDGIVVVDYNWCIGCRYCEAACPYHARRFNFAKPQIPAEEINPDMGYLSNRPRYMGVMEKCTFCLHKTRRGEYPACMEVCPTGSRKFGNLRDPESEVRKIIEQERVFVLKQEAGTLPKFYYTFAK